MIRKLGEIAKIQFGPYEKGSDKGEVKYLLASHFDGLFQPSKFQESYIDASEKSNKFLLQPNDVILSGKGHRIFSWAYKPEFGPVVPSSLFYILRTNINEILGEYLAYYLNAEKIQFVLKLIGAGVTIPSIPKKELSEIEIVVPPLADQKKLIELSKLMDTDVQLATNLLTQKKNLKKGVMNKIITNYIKEYKTKTKP